MEKSVIYVSSLKNGSWSEPQVASFSGSHNDSGPHLTKDGNTLYFISTRPSQAIEMSADIWMVQRETDGPWGKPKRLEEPLNSPQREYSPRTDAAGNLYFASDREGGLGQGDLYVAKYENGTFLLPENLGSPINTEKGEWNLEINQAGNLILFEASERKENVSPYGDLYISFLQEGTWTRPQNIKELNSSGSDLYPYLPADEQMLFFTSSDSLPSTVTNLYQVPFKALKAKYKKLAVAAE